MTTFLDLFVKVTPLYFLIAMGFVARRYLKVDPQHLSRVGIFLVAPLLVFHSGLTVSLQSSYLALPLLFALISSLAALISIFLGRTVFKDSTRLLFAFAAGETNTGYFGLPVIMALLGSDVLTLVILIGLGSFFYENTLGLFLLARGNYSVRASLNKVLRLPHLYAFFLGLFLNFLSVKFTSVAYTDLVSVIKGAYVVLGMMIIGCGIAAVSRVSFDKHFLSLGLLVRFVLFPALMLGLFWINARTGHWLPTESLPVLWILSICPVAANTVAYATEFKMYPEKMALLVFLSTLSSLVLIPLLAGLFTPGPTIW